MNSHKKHVTCQRRLHARLSKTWTEHAVGLSDDPSAGYVADLLDTYVPPKPAPRKLKATWSYEADQALQRMYAIQADNLLSAALRQSNAAIIHDSVYVSPGVSITEVDRTEGVVIWERMAGPELDFTITSTPII